MKLTQLFEDVMGEPVFTYDTTDEGVTIHALRDRKEIGKVVIKFIGDAHGEFEEVISDPEYDFTEADYKKIFPNGRFAEIEELRVNDEEKGKGLGKRLMKLAMNHSRSKGENVMYLNASPLGMSGLNLSELVAFYKKLGFQALIDEDNNVEMFANL